MSTIIDNAIEVRLAHRIRAERETRGWSLADLSERSGVSRAMISKIERGESSPTAGLLGRLSASFGLTLSQLLARVDGDREQLSRAVGQEAWTDPATGLVRRTLTPTGSPSSLELVRVALPAGAAISYPAAAYAFIEDQQVVVLDGMLNITLGAASHEMSAGDCLRFGPPQDCTFTNPGEAPCHYIVAVLRRSR